MTLYDARKILGDAIMPDGGLSRAVPFVGYAIHSPTVTLDGEFKAEELEAIAVWMKSLARDET